MSTIDVYAGNGSTPSLFTVSPIFTQPPTAPRRGVPGRWHRAWQSRVSIDLTEVEIENRVADIVTPDWTTVMEIQDSLLTAQEVRNREHDYRRCGYETRWIFNVQEDVQERRLTWRRKSNENWVRIRWDTPRMDVAACQGVRYLDTGGGCLLKLKTLHLDPPYPAGGGHWIQVTDLVSWLNGAHMAEAA